MLEMIDGFTIPVQMTDDEVERLAELAERLVRPRIRLYGEHGQGEMFVSIDDVQVRFEWDDDADLTYIEDDEDMYYKNGPIIGSRDGFQSSRPEMQRYIGQHFNMHGIPLKETIWNHDANGKRTTGKSHEYRVGSWYIVKFDNGDVRLVTPAEAEVTWEEYQETYGDLSNYESYGAIMEVRDPRTDEWEVIDSIWGCDFYVGPGSNTRTPYTDVAYSLNELRHMPDVHWIISDHFGIDFETLPK